MTTPPTIRHVGRNLNVSADGIFRKTLTGSGPDIARRLRNCLAWEECAQANDFAISPALLGHDDNTLVF